MVLVLADTVVPVVELEVTVVQVPEVVQVPVVELEDMVVQAPVVELEVMVV